MVRTEWYAQNGIRTKWCWTKWHVLEEKIIISVGADLIADCIRRLYHFIRTILSVPLCPHHLSNTILSVYHFVHTILSMPFCPYHFVPYHFVLEPLLLLAKQPLSNQCRLIRLLGALGHIFTWGPSPPFPRPIPLPLVQFPLPLV